MNQTNLKLLAQYILTIEKELTAGNATEHSHRSALKTLIEGLAKGVTATNEPKRIECGAPDFLVTKGALTVGYIEAKDIGQSLDEAEKSDQLKRYLNSLTNLILTDYLEFRWYVDGELLAEGASLAASRHIIIFSRSTGLSRKSLTLFLCFIKSRRAIILLLYAQFRQLYSEYQS